jgi:hypothetical protein
MMMTAPTVAESRLRQNPKIGMCSFVARKLPSRPPRMPITMLAKRPIFAAVNRSANQPARAPMTMAIRKPTPG